MTQSVIQMHCTLSCEMLWESGMSVTCSSPALLNPLHHSMGLAQGQGLVVGGGHCHHPRRYRCSRALCSADPPPESCPVWGLLVSLCSGFPVFTSTQMPCLDTDVFSLASSDMVGVNKALLLSQDLVLRDTIHERCPWSRSPFPWASTFCVLPQPDTMC